MNKNTQLKKGISVVIPVYNTEKYLNECLDSFVNQKRTKDLNYEIIIVNDGSKDGSLKIAKEYQKKFPNIFKVYTKKNGGLSSARNYGIEKANMEYITFVDSDDWVEDDYLYLLHENTKEDIDVLIFDSVEVIDGFTSGTRIKAFKGDKKEISEFIKESTNPSFACSRMFKTKLFEDFSFPTKNIWYEDVATIPVILSFSKNIKYLEKALYYYRQHGESITKRETSNKNLEIIDSWKRVLENIKFEYKKEAEYAVYFSINSFIKFRPAFAEQYLEYLKKDLKHLQKNQFINSMIKVKELPNLFEKEIIPRKIHYFWFGNNPKSELIKNCIESWKKYAPNFEIIEWTEENCDVNECKFVQEAYKAKKWAFVSDYFRAKTIYEEGGIYLDTDMELQKPIDILTTHSAFFHFETDTVAAGIFGAVAKNSIIKDLYESYVDDVFVLEDGSYNTSNTIVRRLTASLEKEYKIDYSCVNNYFDDDVVIYAPDYLMIDVYNGNSIAIHHYDASWWDVKYGNTSYKNVVLKYYFEQNFKKENSYVFKVKKTFRKILELTTSLLKRILPKDTYYRIRKMYRRIVGK